MQTQIPVIDCTKEQTAPAKPEFEKISTDDFETADEARSAQDDADKIIHDLKKMREAVQASNTVIGDLFTKSFNRPHIKFGRNPRYVTDEVLTEDSDILENSETLLKDIDAQIARYVQFAADCDAAAEDLEQQERDDAKYGSYSDQVRSQYYSTR